LRIELSVQKDPQFEEKVDDEHLKQIAERVLGEEALKHPTTVGLLITDDETIRGLNLQYRGQDSETDVLAFGMIDDLDGFVSPPSLPPQLGDVVVSYPRAAEQAAEYGHSVEEELDRLVIHGLLHLLGYDDEEEAQRQEMWAKQEALLEFTRASTE